MSGGVPSLYNINPCPTHRHDWLSPVPQHVSFTCTSTRVFHLYSKTCLERTQLPKQRRYNLSRSGGPEAARGSYMLHMFLSLSVVQYYYLSIVKINPFERSLNQSATGSKPFRFRVKIFRRSTLAGGGDFFHWEPNPLLAAVFGPC